MFDELEIILDRAIKMFEDGASIREIRNYMNSQKGGIAKHLIQEVADRVGITSDELKFDTGDSFGTTRFQRPRNTFELIVAAVIGLLILFRKDLTKVRKGLRRDSTIGGVKVGKKFYDKFTGAGTKKAKDKLLKQRFGDILNGAFKVKLFRRSGMISRRYLVNEARHAGNIVKRRINEGKGKRFMYIPNTAHGYLDQCRPYQGRYWEIDSGVPLPPYHVNCKHVVQYLDKLPKNQKVSKPVVAAKEFKAIEKSLGA